MLPWHINSRCPITSIDKSQFLSLPLRYPNSFNFWIINESNGWHRCVVFYRRIRISVLIAFSDWICSGVSLWWENLSINKNRLSTMGSRSVERGSFSIWLYTALFIHSRGPVRHDITAKLSGTSCMRCHYFRFRNIKNWVSSFAFSSPRMRTIIVIPSPPEKMSA